MRGCHAEADDGDAKKTAMRMNWNTKKKRTKAKKPEERTIRKRKKRRRMAQ